jgi:hypothetical protein
MTSAAPRLAPNTRLATARSQRTIPRF